MTTTLVNPEQPAQLAELTRINTDDLLKAFGLAQIKRGRRLLASLCWWPARQFAQTIMRYDQIVGAEGLCAGGAWALKAFGAQLTVRGLPHVPAKGPVFFLANHPGMTDTIALFASIPRRDLRIIAADRPFLNALPHTARKLIYIHETAHHHLTAIRTATSHLRNGGSLLTFPAGRIEPDPAVLPGALESLQTWAESIALFVRLAPETRIVPTLVSGVLSARAQRSPLRLLRRQKKDQEWLASTLQIILPVYRPVHVQVTFGPGLTASDLLCTHNTTSVTAAVTAAMRSLIKQHYPQA